MEKITLARNDIFTCPKKKKKLCSALQVVYPQYTLSLSDSGNCYFFGLFKMLARILLLLAPGKWASAYVAPCTCMYLKGTSIRQEPEFGTSKHYGKACWSLLSGRIIFYYTVCCWPTTSSNILIVDNNSVNGCLVKLKVNWVHCCSCWIQWF